jgi:hypothetical protein
MGEEQKPKARYPEIYQAVIDDDPEGYFAWVLGELRKPENKGDLTYAEDLLHGFCSAIEQKQEIPKAIREYLYGAFAAYLANGTPIDKALCLAAGRGRPEGSGIRVADGRIYTNVVIAALCNILVKRGSIQDQALRLLAERGICPTRTTEEYLADCNSLADDDWTIERLRRLIRDEREIAKKHLELAQREAIAKGIPKRVAAKSFGKTVFRRPYKPAPTGWLGAIQSRK